MSGTQYGTDAACRVAKRQLRAGELALAGRTLAEIAREPNANPTTIWRDLKSMEIAARRPGRPRKTKEVET